VSADKNVHPITIRVGAITFRSDIASTLATLTARLKELGIALEEADPGRGELRARCVTLPLNMIVWRCWSDKLIFRAREAGDGETKVDIYAVPSFLRLSVRSNEVVVEIRKLLSQLREL